MTNVRPIARIGRLPRVLCVAAALLGCGTRPSSDASDVPADAAIARWECPVGWVPTRHGGCGPAALLCPDGGGSPSACNGINPEVPVVVADRDGGSAVLPYRLPDSGVGGDWTLRPMPCPPDWRRGELGACDPALPVGCPAPGGALPGGRCTPTSRCGEDEFLDPGAEAIGAQKVYVRAAADPVSADGSRARPFASLLLALDGAADGSWILVAGGIYEFVDVTIRRRIHIVGRCARGVELRSERRGANGIGLVVDGPAALLDLRGVRLTSEAGTTRISFGAGLRLADSIVEVRNWQTALGVTGAGSTADIRGSVLFAGRRGFSGVLQVGPGAYARVAGSFIDAAGTGVYVNSGTAVIEDSVIRGRLSTDRMGHGDGVEVTASASVTLTRCALDSFFGNGVSAAGAGTRVVLADVVVSRTREFWAQDSVTRRYGDFGGFGILASDEAQIEASRVHVDQATRVGVIVAGTGTRADLRDVVISRTRESNRGGMGRGLQAQDGSALFAERLRILDNIEYGLVASGNGTSMSVRDSEIAGTRSVLDGQAGQGVNVFGHNTVTLERMSIRDHREAGIYVESYYGQAATVSMRDVWIDGVAPSAIGFGGGVSVLGSSAVDISRVAITRVFATGLSIAPGRETMGFPSLPNVHVDDLFVAGVRSGTIATTGLGPTLMPAGETLSVSLYVGLEAMLDLRRAVLSDSGHGFYVAGGGLTWRDGLITRQLDAAGAVLERTTSRPPELMDVTRTGNANDDVVSRAELPSASALPAPTPVCIGLICE